MSVGSLLERLAGSQNPSGVRTGTLCSLPHEEVKPPPAHSGELQSPGTGPFFGEKMHFAGKRLP
jgi:hypothetical protein